MTFKYSGYTREDVAKTKNDRKGNFDSFISQDVSFFKASEGNNTIRILPPTFDGENRRLFGLKTFIHYNIGVDKSAYLCLNKMQNKPCPICSERAKLNPDTDDEYIKSLNYSGKILIYVLDRNSPEKGPLVWAIPNTALDDIMDDSEDEDTGELLNIDHPEEGYDISFTAIDAGKRTCKYKKVRVSRKATPLAKSDDDFDDVMDFIEKHPLPSILNYYNAAHITAKFGAEEVSDDAPSPRRSRRSEPEEAEKEEDTSPRRSRRSEPEASEKEEDPSPRRSRRAEPEEDTSPRRSRMAPEAEIEGEAESDDLPFDPDPVKEKAPESTDTGSRLSRFRRASKSAK